jgi:hypothetical protein
MNTIDCTNSETFNYTAYEPRQLSIEKLSSISLPQVHLVLDDFPLYHKYDIFTNIGR